MGNKSTVYKAPKNEVYIDLKSGLGNQLFMIAAAYAYTLEHNKQLCMPTAWIKPAIDRPVYWDNILSKCRQFLTIDTPIENIKIHSYHQEKAFTYISIPKPNKSVVLKGYYQSHKYFEKYDTEIRELFSLSQDLKDFASNHFKSLGIYTNDVIVGIHIRRNMTQPVSYYNESKKQMIKKLGYKPRFIYFCEDSQWVKELLNLTPRDIVINGFKDYEEFALLQRCHHFIICNSSFSWWAAYLSDTFQDYIQIPNNVILNELDVREKVVISPSEWLDKKTNIKNWDTIYPSNWNIINSKPRNAKQVFFMGILTKKTLLPLLLKQNMTKCPFTYKYFVGKDDLVAPEMDGNIVYLPCPDNNESNHIKFQYMVKWIAKNYPDAEYVVKSTDMNKYNFDIIKNIAQFIYINQIDYGGTVKESEGFKYCYGDCYFLSRRALNIIIKDTNMQTKYDEDQLVGFLLHPTRVKLANINMHNALYKV
jgi:hypothetical protein